MVEELLKQAAATRASWSAGWDRWVAKAEDDHRAELERVREQGAAPPAKIGQFWNDMVAAQDAIFALPGLITEGAKLGMPAADVGTYTQNHAVLLGDWTKLLAAFLVDGKPASAEDDGAVQLAGGWIIAAGVVVSIIGLCVAVSGFEWASSLKVQAQAQRDEIAGRVEAMRSGKTLQDSTYKPPPPQDNTLLYVGLAAAAAVGIGFLIYEKTR